MDGQRDKILKASWEVRAAGRTVSVSILQLSNNFFLLQRNKEKN